MILDVLGRPLVLSMSHLGMDRREGRAMSDGNGDDARPSRRQETKVILGKDTLMPVGLMIGMAVMLLQAYRYLDSRFTQLERRLELIELYAQDRWTATDQRLWALELRVMNPAMQVPEVTHKLPGPGTP